MFVGVHLKKKPNRSDSAEVKFGQTSSPVIVGKLGPPLLAGQPAHRGENFAPVVFPFTHNALSDIDYTLKTTQVSSRPGVSQRSLQDDSSLTLLLVEVTVDVPLHLCVAPVSHPGQMLTGDHRTRLVVEGSGGSKAFVEV